jgi:2-polyprenyl-3-methyl-5-hydroxy-6-metoxy-1,4-benzoquinol methylase
MMWAFASAETNMTAPISLQQDFWNRWNAECRETEVQDISVRQAEVILGWLEQSGRRDLKILEVGCGAGWFCPQLAKYGRVTGTDLSDDVLARAKQRFPEVDYIAGDFMEVDFGSPTFDVVVTLEVLSHVADQEAFVRKMKSHLRPGGSLMMATQNRFVLQHFNRIPPPAPGQLRKWVDRRGLRTLLSPHFDVQEIFSVSPKANRGFMRAVNSTKLNHPVRAIFGNRIDRLKEHLGLGWTLMVLASKPE